MSVRRSIVVLIIVLVVLPIAVFGLRMSQSSSGVPERRLQEYTVVRGDVDLTVNAIGRVGPETTARVAFTGIGRVTEVLVAVGDTVTEGAVLARLDDTTQQLTVRQREIAVRAAELQRDRLMAGPDVTQLAITQANIDAARGAVVASASAVSPQTVRAAELQVQAAQQAVTDAQQARNTASGGQPEQAYQLLEARIGSAQFNLQIAQEQLEATQGGANGAQVAAAQARLEQAEAELARLLAGPSQAEFDRADAGIRQAQLDLDAALDALDRTLLLAPFTGLVTAVNIEVGALIAAGLPAFELVDLDPLRLTVQVDEIDVRQVREGMTAQIAFDALPDVEADGVLDRIGVVAQNAAGIVNYEVTVLLGALDARVRVGMTAEASFVVEERTDALIVPNEYIRLDRTTDEAFVNLLAADGTLTEVPVTLGLQGLSVSEVTGGINVGDVIAVDLAGDAVGVFGN